MDVSWLMGCMVALIVVCSGVCCLADELKKIKVKNGNGVGSSFHRAWAHSCYVLSSKKSISTMIMTAPALSRMRRRRHLRLRRYYSLTTTVLFTILFLCICHAAQDFKTETTKNNDAKNDNNGNNNNDIMMNDNQQAVTLDVASMAMARRIVKRIKEVKNNSGDSWDTLIQILDHLATSSSSALQTDTNNNANNIMMTLPNPHQHHLSQNEARQRALYWLSHQDTYEQKEAPGLGFLHRYALAVIYFSLEGNSWNRCSSSSHSGTGSIQASHCPTDNERYLSSTSHRSWDGVNGNRDDTVTWLDLSNRNVYSTTFLPLELTLLSPTLELLWISENPGLSGTLPEYIGDFQNLNSLNVHKTNVGGTLPETLYTMNKLSSLRLYKSNFNGSISSNIGNMGRLKWLWIHENEFTGIVPEEIGMLKKLEGVTLHGNKFSTVALLSPPQPDVAVPKEEEMVKEIQEKNEEVVDHHKMKNQKEERLSERGGGLAAAQKEEEVEPKEEERQLRRKLSDGVDQSKDQIKEEEGGADEESTITEEKGEDDWISTLKGNIVPASLCSLMEKKNLKHLWTDCEEDALAFDQENGSDELVIKDGVHACSCCTRCFPKKEQTASNKVATV